MSSAETPGDKALGQSTNVELAQLRSQLGEMIDRESIRQLAASYAHFARVQNIDGLVALYSSDAVFDVPGNMGTQAGARSGQEAIRETLTIDLPRVDPWPFIHQHYIELIGPESAKGFVYFELRLGSEKLRVTHVGFYTDEYVKERGLWKFRSRKLTAIPVPET